MVTRRNGQITANRPKMLGLFTEEFSVTLLSRKNGRAVCDSSSVQLDHGACRYANQALVVGLGGFARKSWATSTPAIRACVSGYSLEIPSPAYP